MKSELKGQCTWAKLTLAASILVLNCTAINADALADQAVGAPVEYVTYAVGYSDLDISKLAGTKTLYLRIRYAAETLCQSAATWGKQQGALCVSKAIEDAVARVNSPLLTQYFQLRSKRDKAGLVQLAKVHDR
jgi:UrcA family protein